MQLSAPEAAPTAVDAHPQTSVPVRLDSPEKDARQVRHHAADDDDNDAAAAANVDNGEGEINANS